MEQMAAENNWTELQMTTNIRPFGTVDKVSKILAIFEIWCMKGCKLRHGIVMESKIKKISNLANFLQLFFPHNFIRKKFSSTF